MLVKDAMTAGLRIAEPDEYLPHAAKKMLSQNIGALPVVEHGEMIGMITDRDIAIRAVVVSKNPADMKVREIMSDECFSCFEDQSLEDAVRIMEENQVRRLPVMDADKKVVGMLSLEDVAIHAEPSVAGEVLKAVAGKKPPSAA